MQVKARGFHESTNHGWGCRQIGTNNVYDAERRRVEVKVMRSVLPPRTLNSEHHEEVLAIPRASHCSFEHILQSTSSWLLVKT